MQVILRHVTASEHRQSTRTLPLRASDVDSQPVVNLYLPRLSSLALPSDATG